MRLILIGGWVVFLTSAGAVQWLPRAPSHCLLITLACLLGDGDQIADHWRGPQPQLPEGY